MCAELTEWELASILQLIASDPLVTDRRFMLAARFPDGTIVVKTGVQLGPMYGYGDRLLLQWEGDRWTVVERARWGS
jgi:hypothetical protein